MGWAVAQQNYQEKGHIGHRCPGRLNREKPLIKGAEKIGYAYGKKDLHKNITPDELWSILCVNLARLLSSF